MDMGDIKEEKINGVFPRLTKDLNSSKQLDDLSFIPTPSRFIGDID